MSKLNEYTIAYNYVAELARWIFVMEPKRLEQHWGSGGATYAIVASGLCRQKSVTIENPYES